MSSYDDYLKSYKIFEEQTKKKIQKNQALESLQVTQQFKQNEWEKEEMERRLKELQEIKSMKSQANFLDKESERMRFSQSGFPRELENQAYNLRKKAEELQDYNNQQADIRKKSFLDKQREELDKVLKQYED
ncbi:hypothetical protein AYK26_04055 [Euryarchaeota archaeon SM23-78]|nr:MAG: hypothetical protein AYK26_04055 [Euryarchaeota archaeon SM23-78]MBW3000956.1 hypothetical protein [Candidatus Woesearchaeota archaeon]